MRAHFQSAPAEGNQAPAKQEITPGTEAAALQPFPGIYWSTVCSQLLLLHPLPQHSKPVLCVCDLDPFRLFFKENSTGQVSASDTIPMKNVTSHNFSLWQYEHENIKHSVKYNSQKQMSKTSNILISGLLPVSVPGWGLAAPSMLPLIIP